MDDKTWTNQQRVGQRWDTERHICILCSKCLKSKTTVSKHLSYLYKLCPWSRTCHSISERGGPVAAIWPRGWGTTTLTRRYWRWGTKSPGWWPQSAPSQSQSERWPATRNRHHNEKGRRRICCYASLCMNNINNNNRFVSLSFNWENLAKIILLW